MLEGYLHKISNYDFDDGAYFIADHMPEFFGEEITNDNGLGIYSTTSDDIKNKTTIFDNYLNSEIDKLEIKSKGNVFVEFTVGLLGEVQDVKILHGLTEYENEKILKVFERLPLFEPGYLNGFPVKMKFTKPIDFN